MTKIQPYVYAKMDRGLFYWSEENEKQMLIRQDGLKSLFHRLLLDHVSEGPSYVA